MPDYVLNISKKGEKDTGQLLVRVGAQNNWMALRSPSWSTAASGRWYRQTNSTKFRQFSYIVLIDTSSKSVASLPEFPYAPGSKFVIGQAETVTFEFYDQKTQETATYRYKGVGLSIGLPIPKIPKTLPGASAVGLWNDFQAPSWWTVRDFGGDARLHSDNLGLGTSVSSNFFEFRGHVNNYSGYEVQINSLQTGRTYSLPSSGETSGSMEISN